jgi:DNA modification methylase
MAEASGWKNKLFFGENLEVLREHIADNTIDLIYLDPPFNSKRDYNLLFKTPQGHASDAQITAFEDTWHWGEQAEREYAELMHQGNTALSDLIATLRVFLRETDLMAYLVMMANRLLELHRVLKPTGSLYLHCDPTASHYLKILLDAVFLSDNFSNEITWRRTTTKSDYKQGAVNWPRVHDILLMYYKDYNLARQAKRFKQPFTAYDDCYLNNFYKYQDPDGRRFTLSDLAAPGRGMRGHPQYEFLGVTRYWRYNREKMQELYEQGWIIQTKPGAVPRLKRYLDEMPGVAIADVWEDVPAVQGGSNEFLGYPTQKPLILMERIITASSNEGDTVLDPFCGCGTAVHAAQKLGRRWIGIDITHLAIALIEKRLHDAFPSLSFEVHGTPKDIEGARALAVRDRYQFQWWACAQVGAQPYQGKKKGADNGIDGLIYFQDERHTTRKVVVSVKSGEHVAVAMVRDLAHVVQREKAAMGLFVTLAAPTEPMRVEALKAGYYESPLGKSYPRIQILTIEGLLAGRDKPAYPDLALGAHTFKKAKVEAEAKMQEALPLYLPPITFGKRASFRAHRCHRRPLEPRKHTGFRHSLE